MKINMKINRKVVQSAKSQGYWPTLQLTASEIADLAEADATYRGKLYDHRPIQGHDMPQIREYE